ncbi:hypothetical protein LCGC14_1063100 [marine sediment metagenome]|uniref:PDGLE domain-containing protein n=1 Tax=marine sediment metagenome TaxID=412755 RepID=A0A0F9N7I1_9ZZZZ
MNKKGQKVLAGFALGMVAFVLILVVFGLIPVFKETLDESRGNIDLNCPGTPDFNETAYEVDGDFNQTVRRPTCFVTGISMIWYIGAVLLALSAWVVGNFRGAK